MLISFSSYYNNYRTGIHKITVWMKRRTRRIWTSSHSREFTCAYNNRFSLENASYFKWTYRNFLSLPSELVYGFVDKPALNNTVSLPYYLDYYFEGYIQQSELEIREYEWMMNFDKRQTCANLLKIQYEIYCICYIKKRKNNEYCRRK